MGSGVCDAFFFFSEAALLGWKAHPSVSVSRTIPSPWKKPCSRAATPIALTVPPGPCFLSPQTGPSWASCVVSGPRACGRVSWAAGGPHVIRPCLCGRMFGRFCPWLPWTRVCRSVCARPLDTWGRPALLSRLRSCCLITRSRQPRRASRVPPIPLTPESQQGPPHPDLGQTRKRTRGPGLGVLWASSLALPPRTVARGLW